MDYAVWHWSMMKSTFKAWLKTKRGRQTSWTAAALVVYALIGFFIVPWILGKVIPKQAGDLLGREVTIEKIRINPFALSGSFQGVLVEDKDGTPLLSWDEVYGNFQLSSIFHWALTFKQVRVVKPYVHLQINPDYTLNISDILEELSDHVEESAVEKEPSIPSLRVEQVTITNAVVKVSDLTLREPFHRQIGPVDLSLEKLYTHPDSENPYSIAGSTGAGEQFAWSGRFFLFPLRSVGRVNVENVRIPNYAPFYHDFVNLTITDGVIDLAADYHVEYGGSNNVLSVSNVAFHLASLKVNTTLDSTENALEVDDLLVSDVEADLWSRTARVGSAAVNGGKLFIHRTEEANINLVEMVQPSNSDTEPAGTVLYAMQAVTNLIATFLTTTNHAVAVIDNLEVNDWALQLEDDANNRPVRLRIDNVKVRGKNLSNVPGEDLSLSLECRWNTNGLVKVDVDAKLFPIHSDVHIQIDKIELPPLDPYAEPFASVLLLDSEFSMDGVVRIRRAAVDAPFDLGFEGDLRLDDFSSVEGLMGTDLLEWESLQLSGIQANLHPLEVSVARAGIHGAKIQLVVETNRSINVLNAMNVGDSNAPVTVSDLTKSVSEPSSSPDASDEESQPSILGELNLPLITVSSVVISNAALDVLDASTAPPLRWTVTDVQGEIGNLSSTNVQRADLRMTAKAGGTAPVEIVGQLNPLNPAVDTDITITLEAMDLLPFDPYSGRYAGYQLRRGSLSLELDYHIRGRKLDSENMIVVDHLALGEKVESDEATKLPVKLGVAVLKDRNGLIKLDVPIQGDLDDPEFRLSRVIGHTLMITLTKMLSSPFSLLGGIAGGSAEELSTFDFLPGSARIQPSATNGLQKLSNALYERPGLEVEIQGSISPESDGLAIQKQKLTLQLKQVRWEELRESTRAKTKPEDILLAPDLRLAALRKYYVQIFPDEARSSKAPPGLEDTFYERMTNKLLDQFEVTEDDFQHLATQRAEVIKVHLIEEGGVDPGRLFLTSGEAATPREGSKALLNLQ